MAAVILLPHESRYVLPTFSPSFLSLCYLTGGEFALTGDYSPMFNDIWTTTYHNGPEGVQGVVRPPFFSFSLLTFSGRPAPSFERETVECEMVEFFWPYVGGNTG